MNLLLDTHAFIWWDNQSIRLTQAAREACENPQNMLYLSIASIWEIQIKIGLGKLGLNIPLKVLVEDQQKNGIEILPVKLEHLWQLAALPHLHGDPFDRILAAQASKEGMKLVTGDVKISQYPVEVLW